MTRTKQMTLGLSAAALALGAGIGVAGMASATTTTPAPTPSASSSATADGGTGSTPDGMGRHGRGGHGMEQASALAAKLGVDEAKVTDALKSFRDANKPSTPPADGQKPDPATREAALAKSLAQSLGIDEAKVSAALQEIRSEEQSEHAAELKTRLDKAVTDGKLTQAEADAVTKAVQNGVIGGGGR
ncbi:hypothetical protein ACFFGR_11990 [Arthrobacter liuii]|uniref:Clp amino terminal domain-containing protein, pathogenicity island component n=1 Tax=Arthrobacter liuii TaxID=1476996 RepID=A0ABQ2AG08_9MICC|nr:hypothetical protein [Arthrobacter liuii]GGH89784.1 hypothetical protein GCM10007170_02020 [Arthrobacter liuii]